MSRHRNNAMGYISREEVEDFDDFDDFTTTAAGGSGAGRAYGSAMNRSNGSMAGSGGARQQHHGAQQYLGVSNLSTTPQRTRIADLSILVTSFPIVSGVVVWKSEPKTFQSRRASAAPGAETGKLSLLLRDSEYDTLSVTVWADNPDAMFALDDSIKVGDVVVANGKIHPKRDQADQYAPSSTSSNEMSVSIGGESSLAKYEPSGSNLVTLTDTDLFDFDRMARQPLGYNEGYLKLADIAREGSYYTSTGQAVNILCAVGRVNPPREITMKNGRTNMCCNVVIFDETLSAFELSIFGSKGVQAAQQWEPFGTVLFLSHAKVTEFRNKVCAQISFNTVVTENPDTPEARQLYNYANELARNGATMPETGGAVDEDVDVSTLEKFVIEQIIDDVCGAQPAAGQDGKMGAVVAVLTHLNIDDEDTSLVCRAKCQQCGADVQGGHTSCSCGPQADMAWRYVLQVHLSDATGTITRCWLRPQAAESLLGCAAHEFMGMSIAERTALKVRLLFERYMVAFKLRAGDQGGSVSILSCRPADTTEVVSSCRRLKTYSRNISDAAHLMEIESA